MGEPASQPLGSWLLEPPWESVGKAPKDAHRNGAEGGRAEGSIQRRSAGMMLGPSASQSVNQSPGVGVGLSQSEKGDQIDLLRGKKKLG